jgi:hypothetical protein
MLSRTKLREKTTKTNPKNQPQKTKEKENQKKTNLPPANLMIKAGFVGQEARSPKTAERPAKARQDSRKQDC